MKKLVSLLMALVLVFAMSSVAMAADYSVADEAALKAAIEDGAKITLTGDITLTSTLEIGTGKTVTIDLNGNTISGSELKNLVHVSNAATLNIYDNSSEGTGEIESYVSVNRANHTEDYSSVIWLEGKLNLYSGKLSFEVAGSMWGTAVEVNPNAWGTAYTEETVFTMNNGTIESNYYGVRVVSFSDETYNNISATFIMNDGLIEAEQSGVIVQQPNEQHDALKVVINDGKIDSDWGIYIFGSAATGKDANVAADENPTDVAINGGNINGWVLSYITDNDKAAVDVAINGGVFSEDVIEYIDYYYPEYIGDVEVEIINGKVYFGDSIPAPPAPKRYTVEVAKTENGDVTVKGSASYDSGVVITAAPHYGYEVGTVTVTKADGTKLDVTERADGTYSFSMPRGEVTIKVTFVPQGELVKMVLTIGSKAVDVNGIATTNDVAPVIKNSRTFLPVRLIAENLGAKVEWNNDAQTVTITKGDTVIVLTVGSTTVLVNGQPAELEAPVFIENSRTYLPVRFIAEKLGADVEWNGVLNTVTITGRK